MIDVTDTSIENELLAVGNQLALVDIHADWCGPCKLLRPVLERFEQETNVPIFALDADTNPETMRELRIMSIPTVLVYKNGKLVDKLIGARTLAKLYKELSVWEEGLTASQSVV